MRKIVYTIQGNIGSGKSTLLKLIKDRIPEIIISPQPIELWKKVNAFNLLNTYYQDPQRWAYTFQNFALITRMNQLNAMINQNKDSSKILFSQRSVIADRQIFAKLLYMQGKMNEIQFQLYQTLYQPLLKLYNFKPQFHHIYLKTSPQVCMKRIKKRGRIQEENISLNYIKNINKLHQNWLANSFTIEGSQQFEENSQELDAIIKKIKVWLKNDRIQ